MNLYEFLFLTFFVFILFCTSYHLKIKYSNKLHKWCDGTDYILNPYFFTDHSVLDEVCKTCKKGGEFIKRLEHCNKIIERTRGYGEEQI